MKNKISKLALLLLVAAAGNSAMAQTSITLPPRRAYTFTGTAASGTGTLTYQWYRNGATISGATSQSYTMPAANAEGVGVEIKRGTMSSNCSGQTTYSNIYNVTFCGILVGQVCWATENASFNKAFATRPDEYTPFFQWNRATAWASTGGISGWNSTADNASTWASGNNPCPTNWRLPTQAEWVALEKASGGSGDNNSPHGGTWAAANAKGNAVAGKFFGPSYASCTISNLAGCIFLPAAGSRYDSDGSLYYQGSYGYYWSGTQVSATYGYYLSFYSSYSSPDSNSGKAYGFSVRCVQ